MKRIRKASQRLIDFDADMAKLANEAFCTKCALLDLNAEALGQKYLSFEGRMAALAKGISLCSEIAQMAVKHALPAKPSRAQMAFDLQAPLKQPTES